MDQQQHPRTNRVFQRLLRVLPLEFREEYGEEMSEVFQDRLAEAGRRRGAPGRLKIWVGAVADLLKSAPREHLSIVRRDGEYAWRMLRSNPGFAIIAMVTLALGIGANVAIFSIVNAVWLRPLPFPESSRVFLLHRTDNRIGGVSISLPIFLAWQEKGELFDSLGVVLFNTSRVLTGAGEPATVSALAVSPGVFSALRVQPAIGRGFRAEDDTPGAPSVVILSNSLWRSRFASDEGIVGRSVTLSGRTVTIIGVMPRGFDMPFSAMRGNQVWYPYRPPQSSSNPSNGIWCIGRLRSQVSVAQAEAALTPSLVALADQFPDMIHANERAKLSSLREYLDRRAGTAPLLLLGAVGLLLLIACANVANLLLVRAASRRREIAVRLALGAPRVRIVRQLLTESILLALGGAVAGVVACLASFDLILRLVPEGLPRVGDVRIDGPVLAFALALGLLTGILFGLMPAVTVSHMDPHGALKEGTSGAGTSRRQGSLRAVLVVGEVTLAFALLMGAALLIQSFSRLAGVDPGFATDHLLTFQVAPPSGTSDTTSGTLAVYDRLAERLSAVPGVQQLGFIDGLPLESQGDLLFSIEGRTEEESGKGDASIRTASPNYFAVMSIPLERGRFFSTSDVAESEPVALINRTMARQFWPERNPVGERIWIGKPMSPSWAEPAPRRIVGVVGDIRDQTLATGPGPMIYRPATQGNPRKVEFVLRSTQPPEWLSPAVRRILRTELPEQPVGAIRTMDQLIAGAVTAERFYAVLLGLFGGLGLLIVAVGVYGMVSYFVSQRTHEIGVRMAFGASRGRVLRMVIGRGMLLTAGGAVLGVVSSYALAGFLRNLLYEVEPNDPPTFAAVAVILAAVTLAACWIPARRVLALDPMGALRDE